MNKRGDIVMKRRILNCVLAAVMIMNAVVSLSGCGGGGGAGGGADGAASKQEKGYFELLMIGDQALAEGRFDDAISAYLEALESDASVPQAYHRIFDTYVRDERYDDALAFANAYYQGFGTEMTDRSDEVYEMEGSEFSGLTPRQEAAAFFIGVMDLGLHLESNMESIYPGELMVELVSYVNTVRDAIGVEELTRTCTEVTEISGEYADLVSRMREAGIYVSADLDKLTAQERAELGLDDPVPTDITMAAEPEGRISPETAAAFEKELRALLDKDPDLIFLYFDIANLYIQAGDREKAEAVYQEGVKALSAMQERRGYITNAVTSLFEARFANLYHLGYSAAAASVVRSRGGYYFMEPDDEPDTERAVPEQYIEALDSAHKEADGLALHNDQRAGIDKSYNKYSGKLQDAIDMAEQAGMPESPTVVEGDADLIMIGSSVMVPGAFDPDSGWLRLHCGDAKGFGCPEDLINVQNGAVLSGEEGGEPMLCRDVMIQYQWREPETGKRISINTVINKVNEGDGLPLELYMVTYDPDGNQLEEEKIYEVTEDDADTFTDDMYSAMREASSGYSEIYDSPFDGRSASVEGDNVVFDVSGVRFSRQLRDGEEFREWEYRCYVYQDLVVLTLADYSVKSRLEIYRLR